MPGPMLGWARLGLRRGLLSTKSEMKYYNLVHSIVFLRTVFAELKTQDNGAISPATAIYSRWSRVPAKTDEKHKNRSNAVFMFLRVGV